MSRNVNSPAGLFRPLEGGQLQAFTTAIKAVVPAGYEVNNPTAARYKTIAAYTLMNLDFYNAGLPKPSRTVLRDKDLQDYLKSEVTTITQGRAVTLQPGLIYCAGQAIFCALGPEEDQLLRDERAGLVTAVAHYHGWGKPNLDRLGKRKIAAALVVPSKFGERKGNAGDFVQAVAETMDHGVTAALKPIDLPTQTKSNDSTVRPMPQPPEQAKDLDQLLRGAGVFTVSPLFRRDRRNRDRY